METRKGRGRPKLGGMRIVLHLTPDLVDALAEAKERNPRISRTELIRMSIEAMFVANKRRNSDRKKQILK
ncbi:MAG: hypothetical protein JXL84_24510 [Deltaproteobacteria bacterium]|nr:hypothetical protein [Deltaproteobacteria bacterium]